MTRIYALLTMLVIFAGCTAATPDEPLENMGEFSLGHNVVVAGKAQKGPVSRNATADEWVTALTGAVGERFEQYQGSQLYHLGISVEGYMLAPKGIPVLYSPKSALIINVTAWDDAAGKKLNDEVEQFTVLETTTGDTVLVGSGRERTKEEQLQGLSRNAVGQIEDWLLKQHKEQGWFDKKPEVGVDGTEADSAAGDVTVDATDNTVAEAPVVTE
jgi:hypothetical protein